MTRILKNKKGVTLVELLAVIVILGIIAAIAVPTIGGLINRQRENAAQATLESVEFAAVSFADGTDTVTAFTLTSLETAQFIDLKDSSNIYSVTAAATTDDVIYIKVTGGVVFFYDAATALPADLTDVFINGFLVYDTP